jgi:hypothetical protein
MTEKPVQHVSDTAHWIAHYRALESARKDALFKDPLAAVLAQARGGEISGRLGFSKAMGWSVAIRTFVIDQFILNAVADGVDTVVNLGAGLDTRPYRLNVPAQLKWIEADFPQIIEFKEGHLKNEKPRCDLRRVRLDLSIFIRNQRVFSQSPRSHRGRGHVSDKRRRRCARKSVGGSRQFSLLDHRLFIELLYEALPCRTHGASTHRQHSLFI